MILCVLCALGILRTNCHSLPSFLIISKMELSYRMLFSISTSTHYLLSTFFGHVRSACMQSDISIHTIFMPTQSVSHSLSVNVLKLRPINNIIVCILFALFSAFCCLCMQVHYIHTSVIRCAHIA